MKRMLFKTLGLAVIAITLIPGCGPSHQPLVKGSSRLSGDFTLAHHNASRKPVKQQLAFYAAHPRSISSSLENAKPYLSYVYQQTALRKMPAEVALLPMIESGYNPFVFSKRGATGIWQMMPGTASGYGIPINWWYDGRRDIIASTKAALDYLAYLHRRFGTWLLALAAYDSGEGTVLQAINHNKQLHQPTDFWSLDLPKETQRYVPKLLALAQILDNPRRYHITLTQIGSEPTFETISINRQVEFKKLAQVTHTNLNTLRHLNAGYRRFATEPGKSNRILLPVGKTALLAEHINEISTSSSPNHKLYRVAMGDSLSAIASRHHTSVGAIKNTNGLQHSLIKAGQSIKIPVNNKRAHRAPAFIAADRLPGPKRLSHTVAHHESLAQISRHYHVTPAQIRFWNNLSGRTQLVVGQKLIIWRKQSRRAPRLAMNKS